MTKGGDARLAVVGWLKYAVHVINVSVRTYWEVSVNRKVFILVLVVAALMVVSVAPAAAQSLDLEVDVGPLFEQISNFFPIFFVIFSIIGGIAASIMLGRSIITAVVQAFRTGFGG